MLTVAKIRLSLQDDAKGMGQKDNAQHQRAQPVFTSITCAVIA
jgi:hypothetical protein